MSSFQVASNLQELTKHRTVDLPIACYETAIQKNIHGHIPLHWHEEFQFVRILKGKAIFRIKKETDYT